MEGYAWTVWLTIKCIQSLEQYAGQSEEEITADTISMAVIGIKGASLEFGPMDYLESEEDRRPLLVPVEEGGGEHSELASKARGLLRGLWKGLINRGFKTIFCLCSTC